MLFLSLKHVIWEKSFSFIFCFSYFQNNSAMLIPKLHNEAFVCHEANLALTCGIFWANFSFWYSYGCSFVAKLSHGNYWFNVMFLFNAISFIYLIQSILFTECNLFYLLDAIYFINSMQSLLIIQCNLFYWFNTIFVVFIQCNPFY